jgi:hypothetical protein
MHKICITERPVNDDFPKTVEKVTAYPKFHYCTSTHATKEAFLFSFHINVGIWFQAKSKCTNVSSVLKNKETKETTYIKVE